MVITIHHLVLSCSVCLGASLLGAFFVITHVEMRRGLAENASGTRWSRRRRPGVPALAARRHRRRAETSAKDRVGCVARAGLVFYLPLPDHHAGQLGERSNCYGARTSWCGGALVSYNASLYALRTRRARRRVCTNHKVSGTKPQRVRHPSDSISAAACRKLRSISLRTRNSVSKTPA